MDKYRIRNVIFEGKCYKTSAILDAELSYVDCIEDLVVDKFFLDNPYYGEFLEAMKEKMSYLNNTFNRDGIVKYHSDDCDYNKNMTMHCNDIEAQFRTKMKYYNHDIRSMNYRRYTKGINKLTKLLKERR
jgi:hypothetical protein